MAEAPRKDAKKHRGAGKSDTLDAHRISAATLPLPVDKLRHPRLNEGVRQTIQILVTERNSMTKVRNRSINALTAVFSSNDLGIDAHKALSRAQVMEIAKWRTW